MSNHSAKTTYDRFTPQNVPSSMLSFSSSNLAFSPLLPSRPSSVPTPAPASSIANGTASATCPSRIFAYHPCWKTQTEIDNGRVDLRLSCLLHFNCDLTAVHRYIGREHIGAHCDPDVILSRVSHLITPDDATHLRRILTDSSPAMPLAPNMKIPGVLSISMATINLS